MAAKSSGSKTWKIAVFVLVIAFGLTLGGFINLSLHPATKSVATQPLSTTVKLDVIPDWGGAGYDAFVIANNFNGTVPTQSSSGPGPNYNTITVPANTTIKFVITSIDTAVNQNFTGKPGVTVTIYNDTNSGMTPVTYGAGQTISNLPVGHSFTIDQLNLNVPIPPDTVVVFNYTFTHAGTYRFWCAVPCGPGMGLIGYMDGYIVVTSS